LTLREKNSRGGVPLYGLPEHVDNGGVGECGA